jgi:hypothetical protein
VGETAHGSGSTVRILGGWDWEGEWVHPVFHGGPQGSDWLTRLDGGTRVRVSWPARSRPKRRGRQAWTQPGALPAL